MEPLQALQAALEPVSLLCGQASNPVSFSASPQTIRPNHLVPFLAGWALQDCFLLGRTGSSVCAKLTVRNSGKFVCNKTSPSSGGLRSLSYSSSVKGLPSLMSPFHLSESPPQPWLKRQTASDPPVHCRSFRVCTFYSFLKSVPS